VCYGFGSEYPIINCRGYGKHNNSVRQLVVSDLNNVQKTTNGEQHVKHIMWQLRKGVDARNLRETRGRIAKLKHGDK